jgi:cytochrome c oxidase subunit 1
LNSFSYWSFLAGGLILNFGWLIGSAPAMSWVGYAPITTSGYTDVGTDLWIVGLTFLAVASTAASVNFIVTILNFRAPGMTMMRMPVFTWMTLVVQFLLLLSFPPVVIGLVLTLFDRNFGTAFYNVVAGGDPELYQHLFWLFGHRGVRFDSALDGYRVGDPPGCSSQAFIRRRLRDLLGCFDRVPRLRRVGSPHVHCGHGRGR